MDRRRSRGPLLWPPLLLVLLLAAHGARARSIYGVLPAEYEAHLRLLKLALALDEDWSPVWSEKLVAYTVAKMHPDTAFCKKLTPEETEVEFEEKSVDTYATVREIVDFCSLSGMYVQFGARLIGASLKCLFNRFAQIDVSAVPAMIEDADDEFHAYLRGLVEDYRVIADRLAAVGETLHGLVELATFFDSVDKESAKLTAKNTPRRKMSEFYDDVWDTATKVGNRLDKEFRDLCAVEEFNWYDKDGKVNVSLEEFKDKRKKKQAKKLKESKKRDKAKEKGGEVMVKVQKFEKAAKEKDGKKDKDKSTGSVDVVASDPEQTQDKGKPTNLQTMMNRANHLRSLMRRMFERLLVGEMPAEMWKDIFTLNVLMSTADIKAATTSSKKKSTSKK